MCIAQGRVSPPLRVKYGAAPVIMGHLEQMPRKPFSVYLGLH